MPNWCNNYLTISAETEEEIVELKEFWKKSINDSGENDFEFNNYIPIPEEKEGDWYEWNKEHWGTKWDVDGVRYAKISEDSIQLAFDTAWCPPLTFIESVSKMYPSLTFTLSFDETGVDYFGAVVFKDGEEEDKEEYSTAEVEYVLKENNLPLTSCAARKYMTDRLNDPSYTLAWNGCDEECEYCEEWRQDNASTSSEEEEEEDSANDDDSSASE